MQYANVNLFNCRNIAQHAAVCQDTKAIRILCARPWAVEVTPSVTQDALVSMEIASIHASSITRAE